MADQPLEPPASADEAAARPELDRLIAAMRRATALLLDTALPERELTESADILEGLVSRLKETQQEHPGARAWAHRQSRTRESWGMSETSPIGGRFNVVAPPLRLYFEGDTAYGAGTFGQQYEGPPGHVHGGYVAAAFDDVLGMAQAISGMSGMTGTLIVRYRRATPLHTEVIFRANLDRVEGRKIFVTGTVHHGDELCAEAEGVFIQVREGHFENLRSQTEKRLTSG